LPWRGDPGQSWLTVTAADGEVRTAAAWAGPGERTRVLRDALVTAERYRRFGMGTGSIQTRIESHAAVG